MPTATPRPKVDQIKGDARANVKSTNSLAIGHNRDSRCFKCQGRCHIATQWPNQRTIVMLSCLKIMIYDEKEDKRMLPFVHKRKIFTLVSLIPRQVYEDQVALQKESELESERKKKEQTKTSQRAKKNETKKTISSSVFEVKQERKLILFAKIGVEGRTFLLTNLYLHLCTKRFCVLLTLLIFVCLVWLFVLYRELMFCFSKD